MTVRSTRRAARSPRATRAALALALMGPAWASAETNPYYLGVSESINHDSNLYRLGDGRAVPASIRSKADTSLTTALIGGIDQNWGRQHVSGSMALRNNRYQHNDQLNYNGYGLNLGWDWATVNNLSGTLSVDSNRNLRRFDAADQASFVGRNVETGTTLSAVARVGVVTRLTAEASLSHREVSFSADAFKGSKYHQDTVGLGGRYQLGGVLIVGLGLRDTRTRYPNSASYDADRQDIDLTATWNPSAKTNVGARLSRTDNQFPQRRDNNFIGATGELFGRTELSGKLALTGRIAHDTGLSASVFNIAGFVGSAQFNRVTDDARIGAIYEATAKISVTANVAVSRRDLSKSLSPDFSFGGKDQTTLLDVGARWLPTRSMQLGCNINHEKRQASGSVSVPYSDSSFGCYGQFTIQ